ARARRCSARQAGRPRRPRSRRRANMASAIVGAADEHDAAVIVTGTRGRSRVAAALLGSTVLDDQAGPSTW
ncbi:MAG TPA: universal stress protein, partial [Solirubrobacteraceae bacterium]|nr:universal stress protein [Solirubrobacteraceae bacterium]